MKRKILIICGPTATGKTRLGKKMAKMFDGEIVSFDSRQVYRGFDIGTGKDLSRLAKLEKVGLESGEEVNCYIDQDVKIWGNDLISAKEEFSVSQYTKLIVKIILNIWERGHLPILVGGSGFYLKALIDGVETMNISPDEDLRLMLSDYSVDELQKELIKIDRERFLQMNDSDAKNSRRLIRAIEIGRKKDEKKTEGGVKKKFGLKTNDFLWIGLSSEKEVLFGRIEKRVEKRVLDGVEEEIKGLIKAGVNWSDLAMQSIGYRQWRDYFEEGEKKEVVLEKWIKKECDLAKRQMTWFKKEKRIKWFLIERPDFELKVVEEVKKWYKK